MNTTEEKLPRFASLTGMEAMMWNTDASLFQPSRVWGPPEASFPWWWWGGGGRADHGDHRDTLVCVTACTTL